ncbi:hypothetical protein Hdeb2414_s0516g00908931 [Helianthus debilis subsp. tardiflorus]
MARRMILVWGETARVERQIWLVYPILWFSTFDIFKLKLFCALKKFLY